MVGQIVGSNMKIISLILICTVLCGCSFLTEPQQNKIPPVNTLIFLPPKWTDTRTPTAALPVLPSSTATDTPTIRLITNTPENPLRYYETNVRPNFSYIPPENWRKEEGDPKFGIPADWWSPDFTSLLVFSMHNTTLSAKEFLISEINSTHGVDIEIISEGTFNNAANLDVYRITVKILFGDGWIETLYAFRKRGFVIEGAYVSVKGADVSKDSLIDLTMNTLQFKL